MPDKKNNSEDTSKIYLFFVILVLIVAIILSIFRIKAAQKKLNDYLVSKKEALNDILLKIDYAKRKKARFIKYKLIARIAFRCLLVISLAKLNISYLKNCSTQHNWELSSILGLITDFNAVLLLLLSTIVFLIYGSIFDMKSAIDKSQNYFLHFCFHKKQAEIDALLNSNLEDEASIKKEIMETENAIQNNEELLKVEHQPSSIVH